MIGRTNTGGGGGGAYAFIIAAYPEGSTCTASNGSKTLRAKDTSGSYVFKIPYAGTWTVSCTDGSQTASATVSITSEGQSESVALSYRVPLEYQEVEYLESTGTQYIKLPIYSSDIASGEIKYYIVTAKQFVFLFGSSNNGNTSIVSGAYGFRISSDNNERGFIYNGVRTALAVNTVGTEYVVEFATRSGSQSYIVNGATAVTGTTTGTNSRLKPNLFTFNYNGGIKSAEICMARVYSLNCFDTNGNAIMELVPCYRRSDSVAGMWDCVSETFLTNAGSGTFTVGPDV